MGTRNSCSWSTSRPWWPARPGSAQTGLFAVSVLEARHVPPVVDQLV